LPTLPVVNCFQIVSLTYRSQQSEKIIDQNECCELLSDCIFDIPITTDNLAMEYKSVLWIAFRLYLWHTDHNCNGWYWILQIVVNCFQIVSLTYRSQLFKDLTEHEMVVNCFQIVSLTYRSQPLCHNL